MGFRKPDLEPAYQAIRHSVYEIKHPGTDGFVGRDCKQELYQLKCWLEDQYNFLPTFAGEDEWEQERIVQILKR
jgi:hypothetical protein